MISKMMESMRKIISIGTLGIKKIRKDNQQIREIRDITSSGDSDIRNKKKKRDITSSGDSGSPGFLPGLSPNHLGSLAEIMIKIRHTDEDRK